MLFRKKIEVYVCMITGVFYPFIVSTIYPLNFLFCFRVNPFLNLGYRYYLWSANELEVGGFI